MMIVIEKNVPLPSSPKKAFQADTLPWKQMEIGDSFVLERNATGGLKKSAFRATGIEILIKAILNDDPYANPSWRIWRIS